MPERPVVLLYTASPRRWELMSRLHLPFETISIDADETPPNGVESEEEIVRIIALRKLRFGLAMEENSKQWGIAADTMVEGPEGLLGKPSNAEDAFAMLADLSGRTHTVHSGLAVYSPTIPPMDPRTGEDVFGANHGIRAERMEAGTLRSLCHSTKVTFRRLGDEEITSYVESGEWKNAAGGYRIQGLGAVLIERIEGLWSTVVGLPLAPLYAILTALSYPIG